MTVTARYSDIQRPLPWMHAFKMFEIDARNRIVREAQVLNATLSPSGSFKISNLRYEKFLVNITFAPRRPACFRLFFEVTEHYPPHVFNRSGPAWCILGHCEWRYRMPCVFCLIACFRQDGFIRRACTEPTDLFLHNRRSFQMLRSPKSASSLPR